MKYISEDALSEILSSFEGDAFTLLSAMINKQKDGVIFFNEEQIAFLKAHSWQWVEVGGGYGFGFICVRELPETSKRHSDDIAKIKAHFPAIALIAGL